MISRNSHIIIMIFPLNRYLCSNSKYFTFRYKTLLKIRKRFHILFLPKKKLMKMFTYQSSFLFPSIFDDDFCILKFLFGRAIFSHENMLSLLKMHIMKTTNVKLRINQLLDKLFLCIYDYYQCKIDEPEEKKVRDRILLHDQIY